MTLFVESPKRVRFCKPRTLYGVKCAFAVAICLSVCACRERTVWSIPVDDVRLRTANGDYSFVWNIDFAEWNAADALALGGRDCYYLSFAFEDLALEEQSLQIRRAHWNARMQGEDRRWQERVGIELVRQLIAGEEYQSALAVVDGFVRRFPDSVHSDQITKYRIESLYRLERDAEVLALLSEGHVTDDAERMLYRAVSSCRRDVPDWEEFFIRLFFEYPVSSVHARAHRFLHLESSRLARFGVSEARAIVGKNLLFVGSSAEAIPLLEEVLLGGEFSHIENTALIGDIGAAYLSAGSYARGGRFLEEITSSLPRSWRVDALEMAGRIYRKGGAYADAVRTLSGAEQHCEDSKQRDRIVWFLLDVEFKISLNVGYRRLLDYSSEWADPEYFSDLIEQLVTDLISLGEWELLVGLYSTVRNRASRESVTRLTYVVARAIESGLVARAALPADHDGIDDLLNHVSAGGPCGYYAFLAGGDSGLSPAVKAMSGREEVPLAASEEIVSGFFDHGLATRGYRALMESAESLDARTLRSAAETLSRFGLLRQAINVANLYRARGADLVTKEELEIWYPSAYVETMQRYAHLEGLSLPILQALVREESYFDPLIVSRSGAVGLMQLLPSTANEAARRIGLSDVDLTDPRMNIALGSNHFGHLLTRVDSPWKALLAYNAGLSRVRQWESRYGHLPADLFVEAVPFLESRQYVKKVVASSVMYGYLYGGKSVEETVRTLFPTLQ